MANLELVVKESSNSHVTPQGQLCVLTWCAPLVFPASVSGMFPQVPGMLSGFVSPALCAWWCLLRSICPAMFAWFCMPGMYALHLHLALGVQPCVLSIVRLPLCVECVCLVHVLRVLFLAWVPALCVLCCVCLALQAQFCGLGMRAQSYTSHSMYCIACLAWCSWDLDPALCSWLCVARIFSQFLGPVFSFSLGYLLMNGCF